MSHDMRQGCCHNKAAQVDHARFFTDNGKHLVGNALGQAGLGENHANHNGTENKEYRRVHEILKGNLGVAYKKKGLQHTDGQASHANGYNLKNPPGCCQQEDSQGPFALRTQNKMLP